MFTCFLTSPICPTPHTIQCIDPYINDTQSNQCTLDTDGDKFPDYRVSSSIHNVFNNISILIILFNNVYTPAGKMQGAFCSMQMKEYIRQLVLFIFVIPVVCVCM